MEMGIEHSGGISVSFSIYRVDFDNNGLPQGPNNENSDDVALLRQMQAAKANRPDQLRLANAKRKKEHFSPLRAGKEFVKGVFRPLSVMIHHPIKTIGAIAATVTVASFAPVTIPILGMVGLGLGVYQVSKGVGQMATGFSKGNYREAEKAFGEIGEGATALTGSGLAMKTAGAIAGEAKATTAALKTAYSPTDKMKAIETGIDEGAKIRQGSWRNAVKESGSLFTSPEGRQSIYAQLNPRAVISNSYAKMRSFGRMFTQAPVANVDAAMRAGQEQLGIADQDMPTLVRNMTIEDTGNNAQLFEASMKGSFYEPKTHTIYIQPDGFQIWKNATGSKRIQIAMDKLPKPIQNFMGNIVRNKVPTNNVITQELTHARQSLQIRQLNLAQAIDALRQGFPEMDDTELVEHLSNWKFAEDASALSIEEAQQAQNTLVGFVQATKSAEEMPFNILEGKGLRPYISAPAKIEARQQNTQIGINRALDTLGKTKSLSSAQGTRAMQDLRRGVVESKLNQHLENLNQLEAEGASTEQIQQEEAAMRATRQTFGAGNITGGMLKQDDKLKAQFETGKKIAQLIQRFKSGNQPVETISDLSENSSLSRHSLGGYHTPEPYADEVESNISSSNSFDNYRNIPGGFYGKPENR